MNKKTILTIALLAAAFFTNAQIKIHDDNHVSIGSLGKIYGLQVHPSGYTYFENPSNPANMVTLANVRSIITKSWVVQRKISSLPVTMFYVDGNGNVYSYSSLISSNPNSQNYEGPIVNPSNSLYQINGFYYYSNDDYNDEKTNDGLHVGFSATEIAKVIPEAVVTDEENNMFINYDVLTVFLVEAMKEQQKEILELREILKDNGLMK